RMAKIVRVLATAHRHPARMAHRIRCGACRASARSWAVPCASAGTLHRARKTPITINSETTTGETPAWTSLVGASAAPSHAPAARPHIPPRPCSFLSRDTSNCGITALDVAVPAFITGSTATRQARQSERSPAPTNVDRAAEATTTLVGKFDLYLAFR